MINRNPKEVDEDLPSFIESIKLSFADQLVMEAQNLRENYFVEFEDPEIIEELDETRMP